MDVQPVERDSRGILDPWLLRQHVRLNRYPPSDTLAGLIDRFWAVQWDLPAGITHTQHVLTHPAANISVATPDARDTTGVALEAIVYGVARRMTTRVLAGSGWAVAAMTTPGGLGAFLADSASALTDRAVPISAATGIASCGLTDEITAEADEADRVRKLTAALERALDPKRSVEARKTAEVARLAETDRGVRRLEDLAAASGIPSRTLQRMFLRNAGVSPTWVIRRYRLLEAGEAARAGAAVSWSAVAAELGFSDQAHLTREFRKGFGVTPAAYAKVQQPGG